MRISARVSDLILLYKIVKNADMEWIVENTDWLFSGVAIALPLAIIGWLGYSKKNKQSQKGGNSSTNIQVGGDFTVTDRTDNE